MKINSTVYRSHYFFIGAFYYSNAYCCILLLQTNYLQSFSNAATILVQINGKLYDGVNMVIYSLSNFITIFTFTPTDCEVLLADSCLTRL